MVHLKNPFIHINKRGVKKISEKCKTAIKDLTYSYYVLGNLIYKYNDKVLYFYLQLIINTYLLN